MPLYEYLCEDCSSKFQVRRAMSEREAPAACPECRSDRVERQISLVFAAKGGATNSSAMNGGCGCGSACGCASRG